MLFVCCIILINWWIFLGGTKRCAGYRLRLPCDGHGRGCRGGVERGSIFRAEEFQSAGGEDTARVREPHPAGASQHR